jgi:pimeloyl-ACP methyl ester carboxylesterase
LTASLRVRSGGTGEPVLLLLHGLGATGDVWDGLHRELGGRWPGRWVTPDLPGHGGSAPLEHYSFGHVAAVVAQVVPAAARVVALGHSLGGVIALVLASGWFGFRLDAVAGLGIKVAWTDEDLGRTRALASRPSPVFATRREAAERHLKVAGLVGLMEPDAVPEAALTEASGGWTTTFDPRAFAIGAPDLPGLLAASRAAVTLAAGANDPMSRADQLRALVPTPVILTGLGHNAQVESPAALWPLLYWLLHTSRTVA